MLIIGFLIFSKTLLAEEIYGFGWKKISSNFDLICSIFESKISTILCLLPHYDPEDCKSDEKGSTYTGKISTTRKGYTCQKWNTNYPHDLRDERLNIIKYLNVDINDYDHNYCRNPGSAVAVPICYTTNPEERWDYCDIPICNSDALPILGGKQVKQVAERLVEPKVENRNQNVQVEDEIFMAPAASPTRPTLQEVESRKIQSSILARQPQIISNVGRNQNTNQNQNIDLFAEESMSAPKKEVVIQKVLPKSLPKKIINKDCYQTDDKGQGYAGAVSKSLSGTPCQAWTSNNPVSLKGFANHFRKSDVNVRNYPGNHCRNPTGYFDKPICITGYDSKKYEFCDIEICGEDAIEESQNGGEKFIDVSAEENESCGLVDCDGWVNFFGQNYAIWRSTIFCLTLAPILKLIATTKTSRKHALSRRRARLTF